MVSSAFPAGHFLPLFPIGTLILSPGLKAELAPMKVEFILGPEFVTVQYFLIARMIGRDYH